jgi:NAD(P)-dependent dehydrogenase (short-subunit alcohol dehydrogenase family)
MIIKADMTVTSDARRAVRVAVEGLGGLDIILSNAVSSCF